MKTLVRKALFYMGYWVEGIRYTPRHLLQSGRLRLLEFDDVICRHMFERGQSCTFVQIGAYDGVSTDPLRKYIERCGWRGVMLEPQPRPASQLRQLYAQNNRITVIEAALDGKRGVRRLYTVESDDLPKWAGGMASFERKHLLKHDYLIPGIKSKVQELAVSCITFVDILNRLASNELDVLQIDAEGADGYLISLFPFDRIRPAIIHWESKNMSRPQQEETLELLCRHGYRIARSGAEDMMAILPGEPE